MSTALAIVSPQQDAEKTELIKQTVARGATDMELALFLYTAKRTGLDPLLKQIYAIKRWDAALGREAMTIQTGIDGFRLVATRTGKLAGIDDSVFETNGGEHPVKATVTVYKLDETGTPRAYTASARWEEYKQTKKDGTLTSFWKRMPYGQLGKCAEALALRKAFPADLSGVYSFDEMQQSDHGTESHLEPRTEPAVVKCEKCEKDIVAIDNPQGKKYSELTALQAIAYSEKNYDASWCWECIIAAGKPVDDSATKASTPPSTPNGISQLAPSTTHPVIAEMKARQLDADPDPMFSIDTQGKPFVAGTVTQISITAKSFQVHFGKERLSTFPDRSMCEHLKGSKGKFAILEYALTGDGKYKNIVAIRKLDGREFDNGVPVIGLHEDFDPPSPDMMTKPADEDLPF